MLLHYVHIPQECRACSLESCNTTASWSPYVWFKLCQSNTPGAGLLRPALCCAALCCAALSCAVHTYSAPQCILAVQASQQHQTFVCQAGIADLDVQDLIRTVAVTTCCLQTHLKKCSYDTSCSNQTCMRAGQGSWLPAPACCSMPRLHQACDSTCGTDHFCISQTSVDM